MDVVTSWNGRQNAVKLGSPPVTFCCIPTIQIRVPLELSIVLVVDPGGGGLRRPYRRVEENVNQ